MAPTNVTYGKKRNLLRSWGSRRRQRAFADSLEDYNQELPAAPLIQSADRSKRATRSGGIRRSNRIGRMASDVLDDTDVKSQDEAARVSDENVGKLPSSKSMPMPKNPQSAISLDRGPISPFTMHPVFMNDEVPSDAGQGPSRVDKAHTKNSGEAMAGSSIAQNHAASLQPRNESGLLRSAPEPAMSPLESPKQHADSDGGSPDLDAQPVSAGGMGTSNSKQKDTVVSGGMVDADEINEKVMAMLAATDALKPKTSEPKASSATKMSRMDRFASRPSTPDARIRGKLRKQPAQGGADGHFASATAPRSPEDARRPSTNSMDICPDKGINLNKRKVQKILCGSADRKPATVAYKSLRTGQATDVSSGELTPQTPRSAEDWRVFETEAGLDDAAKTDPRAPQGPFETEVGFEHNLEDRILSTPPVGSSTPRALSCRESGTDSIDDSEDEIVSSAVQVDLARVPVRLGDDDAATTPVRKVTLKSNESKRVVKAAGQLRPEALRSNDRLGSLRGSERVKKHPSPSKKELQELEQAFQRKKAAMKLMLPDKDQNRLMRGRTSSIRDTDPLAQLGLGSARKSRIPQPVHNRLKLRPGVRLAPPFRPPISRPDDSDELL
ncbi:Uncharacterized protein TCAP_06219 [Tolypocladium capitatum]|uniref:Uncharacterized protein n=1 Tax=Tolypocladium capitatum TaxID=45235 RepID=A0A2K3Q8I4_9HYPO|nr:Uncharacterized protein TCAP_06219 [Tolypocladium capitatum]